MNIHSSLGIHNTC